MIEDQDNQVYYDTEKGEFYLIKWEDGGNGDYPYRFYINTNSSLLIMKKDAIDRIV